MTCRFGVLVKILLTVLSNFYNADTILADYFKITFILVKNHFKINGTVLFQDRSNLSIIPDGYLEEYVEQYRCSPGWGLEAIDVESGFTICFFLILFTYFNF